MGVWVLLNSAAGFIANLNLNFAAGFEQWLKRKNFTRTGNNSTWTGNIRKLIPLQMT